ncbi:MAG: hypothetical protein P4L53_26760 [Candidatus Obscuribacterales bacterium]|nr:hypothetical protein [Candidatus Obscuribacterales bacterium]
MRSIDSNYIGKQFIFCLLLRLIVEAIQVATSIGNYAHAVMVAHGLAPK